MSGMTIGSVSHDSKIGWLEVPSSWFFIGNQHYAVRHWFKVCFWKLSNISKVVDFILGDFLSVAFAVCSKHQILNKTLFIPEVFSNTHLVLMAFIIHTVIYWTCFTTKSDPPDSWLWCPFCYFDVILLILTAEWNRAQVAVQRPATQSKCQQSSTFIDITWRHQRYKYFCIG